MARKERNKAGKHAAIAGDLVQPDEMAEGAPSPTSSPWIPLPLDLGPSNGAIYPLKLTLRQRESLIECTNIDERITNHLRAVAGFAPEEFSLTRAELEHLFDEIGLCVHLARGQDRIRLETIEDKINVLIANAQERASSERRPLSRTKGGVIYQFKVTLFESDPRIWRRIQVPDCHLGALHDYIQAAFGWGNEHGFEFRIGGLAFCPNARGHFDCEPNLYDAIDARISELVPTSGRKPRWEYTYDFGDDWKHQIVFEGAFPALPRVKYPQCVDGERACPPEDCGGTWGYYHKLETLSNPEHPDYEHIHMWFGGFKPDAFNVKQATKRMRSV